MRTSAFMSSSRTGCSAPCAARRRAVRRRWGRRDSFVRRPALRSGRAQAHTPSRPGEWRRLLASSGCRCRQGGSECPHSVLQWFADEMLLLQGAVEERGAEANDTCDPCHCRQDRRAADFLFQWRHPIDSLPGTPPHEVHVGKPQNQPSAKVSQGEEADSVGHAWQVHV